MSLNNQGKNEVEKDHGDIQIIPFTIDVVLNALRENPDYHVNYEETSNNFVQDQQSRSLTE